MEANSLLVIQFNFFLPIHSKVSSRLSNRERGLVGNYIRGRVYIAVVATYGLGYVTVVLSVGGGKFSERYKRVAF